MFMPLNVLVHIYYCYSHSWLNDVFPLGCGSIVCALEVHVKEHSNVVNGTLSGSSSRVIRGKL